jgi:hypothetical protein
MRCAAWQFTDARLLRLCIAQDAAADDAAGRSAYLAELLRRDPALFLGACPAVQCGSDAWRG